MSGHTAGHPLECFVNQVVIHKAPLLDERGNHKRDEDGKPKYLCGFRIAGGIDQDNSKSPQGYPDKGVYVTYVNEGSVAEKAGLKVHDKILQVNGHDMTMATHKKAVDYICRKVVLEMFVYRPDKLKGGNHNQNDFNNKTYSNIGNLENEMNKMNVRKSRDQHFGDFEGRKTQLDNRQGQEHYQPQPHPRTHYSHDSPSHGMPTVDNFGYGKQFEADQMRRHSDYPVSQQQKFLLSEGGIQATDSGRYMDNYQQQHGPLKPPRWQQYTPHEHHQQQQQQRSPNLVLDQNKMHFERNYNIGRQDLNQNIGAFENQISRPNLSSDYRQEVNPPHHPSVPTYSHSAHHSHRYNNNSRNLYSQQPTSYQQQRSYGVSQSRPAYSPEKRSTLPSNPILPSQNKFY